jgi:hypothetical protein
MTTNKLERKMNLIEWIMLGLLIAIIDGAYMAFNYSYLVIVSDIINVIGFLAIGLIDLLVLWLFLDNKR